METPITSGNEGRTTPNLQLQTVEQFFSGRMLLVSGATGFIGKVLIEKLLRCCTDLAGIFVLMRPKKGRTAKQRGEDLANSGVFRLVRDTTPHFLEKIIVIEGEITKADLGLKSEDIRRVIEETSVVFHVAATVRFDEPLRIAVETNLMAVKRMVDLCKRMKQLRTLVHVSTAYANCNREYIDEIIYKPTIDPENLLDMIEWLPDEAVQAMTPHLLQSMPNTYTFTKGLAEYYLLQRASDLPLAIVRPSIVTASWKEPFPGWTDNATGLNNMLIATGKGFLRSMKGDWNAVADVIPVDISVNLMIVVAWRTGISDRRAASQPIVYNCTTGSVNPLKWGELESSALASYRKNPLELAFRRPKMSFTANPLVKTFGRIHRAVECVQYFTSHQWHWSTPNVQALMSELSGKDLKTFYLDARELDWSSYIENYCLGTKRFILKEDISQLPRARRHMRRLQVLRYAFNTILLAMLWRFLIANSHLAGGLWYMVLNLVFKFVRFCRFSTTCR